MATYRIYRIGPDGHFFGIEVADCVDDEEVFQRALQAANGHDVEIWDRKRFVARIPGNPPNEN